MILTKTTAKQTLTEFREKYGITQEKLSEKSGVSVPTIIGIEKGTKDPHATTIFKLNKYLSLFN